MKKFILFFLVSISLQRIVAQQQKPMCGYDMAVSHYISKYPAYRQARETAFANAKSAANLRAGQLFTIPVVVHVLWKNSVENLPDSVIYNQIDVLNADYGRTNADTINCRAMFDSVGANTGIQFVLTQINRVQTNNDFTFGFSGMPDSITKYTAAGGSDAVDPIHNLNIWIINFQPSLFGQLLGYAYPPANLSNWPAGQEAPKLEYEGVVIDYRAIGNNNPNTFNLQGVGVLTIKGRTATHEVGHYLGLRHIWGDGGIFGGANDCMQSDGIDDTPFANAQSDFNCDKTKNSCSGTDAYYHFNAPDMVENYMDYSAEDCMNLFTRGQGSHMRGVLLSERADLPNNSVGIINTLAEKLSVYPVPAENIVYISHPEAAIDQIVVLNAFGQKVIAPIAEKAAYFAVDVTALTRGIYFVDITVAGQKIVKKIIVQ